MRAELSVMTIAVRRTAAAALAAALVLVALLSLDAPDARAQSSTGALGPAVGTQVHGTWSDWTPEVLAGVLDKMAAAGTTWIRLDVGWASLEYDGRGRWSTWYADRVERVVRGAEARGLQVLATLWATPPWANGGQDRSVAPHDPADYARAARWAAERWRGRIAAWEVWNEPNHKGFFAGADPVAYAQLLKAAYPAFKAGDPGATVVLGGPSYNDVPWLSRVYEAGAAGSFDVMATHPYNSPGDLAPEVDDGTIWTLPHVEEVHALMVRHGDGGKPIWFTEYGWSAHANAPNQPNWSRGVTAVQQGEYLVRSLELIRSRYPYVTNVFWYMARDRKTGDAHQDGYGLLTYDLAPKPAYAALAAYLAARAPATAPTPGATPSPTASPTPAASPLPTTSPAASPAPTTSPTVAPASPAAPSSPVATTSPAPTGPARGRKGATAVSSVALTRSCASPTCAAAVLAR